MSNEIRPIVREDLSAVLGLMREFAEFENLTANFGATEDRLRRAMFDEGAFVEGLIASVEGSAAGYSLYYPNFASFRAQRGLFLEDIYVSERFRGQGLGELMLCAIARSAVARGMERIDFHVLEWNKPALAFYTKLGAIPDNDERHFKFTDDAFKALAG